ncbi:MAG: metallophosphoesterase [Archaeoglobaceae archaeon]
MKILAVGDTHLGRRPYNLIEKEKDIFEIFDYILNIAKNYDLVIFLGDLIETEKNIKIKIEVSQALIKMIESLRGKFLIVRGNHDNSELVNCLMEYSFPCQKFEDGWLVNLENLFILGIHHSENLSEVLDLFKNTIPSEKTILCLHADIKELLPFSSSSISLENLKHYKLVINGHLHNHYQKENYLGTGAVDIFRRDEIQETKNVYEIILTDEKIEINPIPLPIRPTLFLNSKKLLFEILSKETLKKPIIFYSPATQEDTLALSDMLIIEEKTLMFKIITQEEASSETTKETIQSLLNYANFNVLETLNPKQIILDICKQFEVPEYILTKLDKYLDTRDKNILKEVIYAIEEIGN